MDEEFKHGVFICLGILVLGGIACGVTFAIITVYLVLEPLGLLSLICFAVIAIILFGLGYILSLEIHDLSWHDRCLLSQALANEQAEKEKAWEKERERKNELVRNAENKITQKKNLESFKNRMLEADKAGIHFLGYSSNYYADVVIGEAREFGLDNEEIYYFAESIGAKNISYLVKPY